MQKKKTLWEILVPANSNEGNEFSLEHHLAWDKRIMKFSDEMTILKPAKGRLVSPEGQMFVGEMIPVRIYCGEFEIKRIMDYTKEYYNQKTVLAYEISDNLKFV